VFGFLLTILVLDGFLLGLVVLMQAGKGDGLAAMGGSGSTMADSVLGGRQAVTLLTKTTWVTGAIFLGLTLVLSVMSSRATNATSVLEGEFNEAPAPQPLLPTVPGATGAGAAQGAGAGAAAIPDTSK